SGGGEPRLMTWRDKYPKTEHEPIKRCPADVPAGLRARLVELAVATFRACQCRDYARVDIRLDANGEPHVLEINSMASLGASGSFLCAPPAAGVGPDAPAPPVARP